MLGWGVRGGGGGGGYRFRKSKGKVVKGRWGGWGCV